MLATSVEKPFDDPEWLFEIKWDGYRGICTVDEKGKMTLLSRNGLDLLAAMKERGLNIATLMISGVGQIDDAVRAIKLGAYDYLTKPVDLDRLEVLLKNLTSHVKLSEENQRLRRRRGHE